MNKHQELLQLLNEIIEKPPYDILEVSEILEDFARGSFGLILTEAKIKELGGVDNIIKMSTEILAKDKPLNNKKNNK